MEEAASVASIAPVSAGVGGDAGGSRTSGIGTARERRLPQSTAADERQHVRGTPASASLRRERQASLDHALHASAEERAGAERCVSPPLPLLSLSALWSRFVLARWRMAVRPEPCEALAIRWPRRTLVGMATEASVRPRRSVAAIPSSVQRCAAIASDASFKAFGAQPC